jgi:hypothetical protein
VVAIAMLEDIFIPIPVKESCGFVSETYSASAPTYNGFLRHKRSLYSLHGSRPSTQPSGKLKSPHLNYSPDREFRIKETKRAHKAMLKPQDTVVARRVVIANGGGVPHIPDWVGQIPRKYPSERLLHSQH